MQEIQNNGASPKRQLSIKVFGVGGGGGNAVDQMASEGFPGVELMVMNTDAQALSLLNATAKLMLGNRLSRGLGTGGDPELGRAAAEEDAPRLKALCQGADVVFIVAGLGGGTGTGASPILAHIAKEAGALVLAVVTLPFECEGGRRQRQALMGLQHLKQEADAVICLPNQKILKMIDENTSLVDTFHITNGYLAQGVRGIWRLLTRPGLINIDFADLCTVTRGRHAQSSLATAKASGENRARELVDKLLAHPLLDGGQALTDADAVLVSLSGGPDLTMAEVNRIMEQINRQCENAQLIMGASIEENCVGSLEVTVVASSGLAMKQENLPAPEPQRAVRPPTEPQAESEPNLLQQQMLVPGNMPRPTSRFVAPAPSLPPEKTEEIFNRQNHTSRGRKRNPKLTQSQLKLEIISKGRFEKSEPTIRHGEDLDVPTYIRRGIPLN